MQRVWQFVNYEQEVSDNQGNLWGGEGSRIKRAYENGEPLIIMTDRKTTLERFKKGELVYKESPLGGCTKLGSCDRLSITNITACTNCEHAILDNDKSIRKIKRVIRNLEASRNSYSPESLHYCNLNEDINRLKLVINQQERK